MSRFSLVLDPFDRLMIGGIGFAPVEALSRRRRLENGGGAPSLPKSATYLIASAILDILPVEETSA
jgi:hypothetical protein